MKHFRLLAGLIAAAGLMFSAGCKKKPALTSDGKTAITIALNWVPEPEFGGIYAAEIGGSFANHNLAATIEPGGAGAPVLQRVAAGQVEFGVCSADELLLARSKGADVVAVFTIYQTCPQGIMVHRSRGVSDLKEVFQDGTLAVELGLTYFKYLKSKYTFGNVKLVPYDGGIGKFLADKQLAQQCFIFSEPLAARRKGADPQVFLVAESGYNPYTGVIATRGDYARKNPQVVKDTVAALREGWEAYLKDPKAANNHMATLNTSMDRQTFDEAADAQKSLVTADGVTLGSMSPERWATLGRQLVELKVLDVAPPADQCMVQQ